MRLLRSKKDNAVYSSRRNYQFRSAATNHVQALSARFFTFLWLVLRDTCRPYCSSNATKWVKVRLPLPKPCLFFSKISFNSPAELHGQKIWNTINLIHDDNNNGCVAHWIRFALSSQRSRARLPAVRCRCFLFSFWKHIGSVLQHQFIIGNNVTFDSKPKQARSHFLIWDYY